MGHKTECNNLSRLLHRPSKGYEGRARLLFPDLLPPEVDEPSSVSDSVRENVREALASLLATLDLVTREEFEVQAELLTRAYARVEQLEARLERYEEKATFNDR